MPESAKPKSKWIAGALGAAVFVLLLLYMSGTFDTGQVEPGRTGAPADETPRGKALVLAPSEIPRLYTAVGTVRSRDEVEISPRITARVVKVEVRSGDTVKKGELLLILAGEELKAAARQARETVESAKAALELAKKEAERAAQLLEKGVMPKSDYDRAMATRQQAGAGLAAAEQAELRAEAALDYATIEAPMDAVVGEKNVDTGDLAAPGNILLRLFDPARLLLEVPVREGLVRQVQVGTEVRFTVPALQRTVAGKVEEVVPSVDPQSRTFLVKVFIGKEPELVPGMYGTFELTLGTEEALLLPRAALKRVGQVEYVLAETADGPRRLLVRSIPHDPDRVRVVSGLAAGMTIYVPEDESSE